MFVDNLLGGDGLILIVVVVVLLFGGSAIPKLARNLGSAKTEFEKGLSTAKAAEPTEGKEPESQA
ncbi:MAG: twin-arginine translocase TatA/TatE family subunit [Actinomycetota bacterium]|jgi:sec-independent protein translocase protein TatA